MRYIDTSQSSTDDVYQLECLLNYEITITIIYKLYAIHILRCSVDNRNVTPHNMIKYMHLKRETRNSGLFLT